MLEGSGENRIIVLISRYFVGQCILNFMHFLHVSDNDYDVVSLCMMRPV